MRAGPVSGVEPNRTRRWLFVSLFILAAALRAIDVNRPVDGSLRSSWRECDVAAMARNFYREGMNPLFPRIDWRKDGPGFAEAEFPFVSWLTAVGYHLVGVKEELGRWITYGFVLLGNAAFLSLAFRRLGTTGTVGAGLFWAAQPLLFITGTALQPEPVMLSFAVLSVALIARWQDTGSTASYWGAAAATSLAILAKSPGAFVGLVIGSVWLKKDGLRALKSWRLWTYGAIGLLPGLLWYAHAKSLWHRYGNSLGLSNEHHWLGVDTLTSPWVYRAIIELDIQHVWSLPGAIVGLVGLCLSLKSPGVRWGICWLAPVYFFYVLAARTTSASWAYYYHVIAVPGAALIFGAGVDTIPKAFEPSSWNARRLCRCAAATIVAGSALLAFASFLRTYKENVHPAKLTDLYECAKSFQAKVEPAAAIAVIGRASLSESGRPVAHDNPYFFYWMDKKGFVIAIDQLSISALEDVKRKGVSYLVAEERYLNTRPDIAREIEGKYKLIEACEGVILFKL